MMKTYQYKRTATPTGYAYAAHATPVPWHLPSADATFRSPLQRHYIEQIKPSIGPAPRRPGDVLPFARGQR